jgi:outer membrane protein OmpA-like peptidoglycan-associated protein
LVKEQDLRGFLSGFLGAVALLAGTQHAAAFEPTFTAPATLTRAEAIPLASHSLPIGAFIAGRIESRVIEAPLARAAYRVDISPDVTTLDLVTALRGQVQAAGFDIAFECSTQHCGGFDFRFALDLLPEPDMHIDLGDFRYLLAQRADRRETLALVVSRSPSFGFVHITKLGDFARQSPSMVQATKSPYAATPAPTGATQPDLIVRLRNGPVVLSGLKFTPSSTDVQVEGGDLADLAQWLAADPTRAITLVGYTDTSGNADDNLALSQSRADSLRAWMLAEYAIAPTQIMAEGRGAASPIAPNDTAEGRAQNRRIEAVLPN